VPQKKSRPLLFYDNFCKVDQFSQCFTIKFRKDLWMKTELGLKLTPALKSVAALPCEM